MAGGAGAGLSELESARTALGEHPLVAVGLAERWAAMGNARAAVKAYQVALSGPLLDLRKPGRVAMEGAQAAIQGQLFDEARLFLDIAEGHPDVAAVARAARWQLDRSDAPAMTRTAPGRDHSVEDLEAAIRKATTPIERARSRLALGRARLDRGDAQAAEPLLWEALADGLVDAGEALASILSTSQDRARDSVRVRRLQVTISRAMSAASRRSGGQPWPMTPKFTLGRSSTSCGRSMPRGRSPRPPSPRSPNSQGSSPFSCVRRRMPQGRRSRSSGRGPCSSFSAIRRATRSAASRGCRPDRHRRCPRFMRPPCGCSTRRAFLSTSCARPPARFRVRWPCWPRRRYCSQATAGRIPASCVLRSGGVSPPPSRRTSCASACRRPRVER